MVTILTIKTTLASRNYHETEPLLQNWQKFTPVLITHFMIVNADKKTKL